MARSKKCPRCGNALHEIKAWNALSRIDTKTVICSTCGNGEGLLSISHGFNGLTLIAWANHQAMTRALLRRKQRDTRRKELEG
jgi:hypothetical protein